MPCSESFETLVMLRYVTLCYVRCSEHHLHTFWHL